jgi:hypothetical protein
MLLLSGSVSGIGSAWGEAALRTADGARLERRDERPPAGGRPELAHLGDERLLGGEQERVRLREDLHGLLGDAEDEGAPATRTSCTELVRPRP